MRLSTTHQIVIGCAAALVILVLLSEIAYKTASTVRQSGGIAARAQSVLLFSESLSSQLDAADQEVRSMVRSGDFEPTAAYRTATSRIRENLRLLDAYAGGGLPHRAQFASIGRLAASKLDSVENFVDSRGDVAGSVGDGLDASESVTSRLQAEVEQLQRSELEYLATQSIDESVRAQRTKYSVLVVTVGAVIFLTLGASSMIGDARGRKKAESRLRTSEERFRALAAHAPIGIFLAGPGGELNFVNDRYTAITGLTIEDVSGTAWADGLHPDDRDAVSAEWREAAIEGRAFASEYRSIRPDGRVVWIIGRSAVLRDDLGGITGFVGTVSDITDRKLAEAERDRFFNLSLDMLSINDFHGSVRRLNPAWSDTLGFNLNELKSTRLIDFVHPEDRMATQHESARLMRGGSITRFENRVRTRDGSYRWLSWNAASDMDQKLIYSIARDVTDARELQEQLREKNQELERQNAEVATATRQKSEFLANMSHELRTPLNGIIGFAELMRDGLGGPITETNAEFLDDILLSSQHLLHLINDILDLAKVEAGKITFRPEKVRLDSVIGEVRQMVREMAAKNQVELRVEVDPSLPEVELDPARLRQVLYNYISNALKFTEAGGKVVVRATPLSERMFRLEVEDTGIGIRSDDVGKLFSEFQQLDEGAAKKYQGTGLGLALTRRIVEAQGGSVGVSSRWGEGSTFYAILPVRSATETEEPARRKLLIVRGTGETDDTLLDTLGRHAFSTRVVTRGTEAMEVAGTQVFDAIVLDLNLPDMDAGELLDAIRKTNGHASAPVVAVTALDDRRIVSGLPVQGFIERPVRPGPLIEALGRAGLRVSLGESVTTAGARERI